MPAAPVTLSDFTTLIVRSGLLTTDELQGVLRNLKPTGQGPQDIETFRRALIVGKHLTDYQAALLMRGHADGFRLGPYTILDLIAKGRMAGVYKAIHDSGQVVAIKVLPSSKAKDSETLARFRREGRLLTRLDHANVVRAFHIGEEAGKHYLVLEYLDGDTLDELIERHKKLPPTEAIRVVQQALQGLQQIHERGMIHRDLKPANLMLLAGDDTNGRAVKILDIGLGKAVFDESAKSLVDDPSQLTTDGVLIGTPDYLAPEQARRARTADIRSDVYSLGCVLFHALTGQPPFPDKSVLNTVMRHATETPKPLSEFLAPVPDGLQNVLNWMMAKDPAQRYATPEKAAQALGLLLRHAPTSNTAAAPLPAYEKWLAAIDEREPARPTPTPPPSQIPIGRLEVVPRKHAPGAPPAPAGAPGEVILANFDVELVTVPMPGVASGQRAPGARRGLFELSRRDVIMLVAGGILVLSAILAGWGLNKLLKTKPPPHVEPAPVEPGVPSEG